MYLKFNISFWSKFQLKTEQELNMCPYLVFLLYFFLSCLMANWNLLSIIIRLLSFFVLNLLQLSACKVPLSLHITFTLFFPFFCVHVDLLHVDVFLSFKFHKRPFLNHFNKSGQLEQSLHSVVWCENKWFFKLLKYKTKSELCSSTLLSNTEFDIQFISSLKQQKY